MKTMFRILVIVLVTMFLMGTNIIAAKAETNAQDLSYNPAAEEYLKAEVLKDGSADLAEAFTEESQRVVRGEFIASLWKDPEMQGIPFFKIYNTTINGNIDASGFSIPFDIEFWFCNFEGRIEMIRSKIRSFNMYNSTVSGAVRMNRIVVDEDLALYESTYEKAVVLFDATIGGSFFAARSKFNGTEVDPGTAYPFELWEIQVEQTTELRGATIKGEAMFENAEFGVDAVFEGTVFEKSANFKNFKTGNFAGFKDAVFKDWVSFESGTVDRDAAFTGATFNGAANFNYLTVVRFADFDFTTFHQGFLFTYTEIGWPYFEGAVFNGEVDFEGMQAGKDFDFTDASYNYLDKPFTVKLATVDGAVKFDGFTAPAGLSLEHNQFGSLTIIGKEDQAIAFINLASTKVDSDLNLENIKTDQFFADGLTVSDTTTFKNVKVAYSLDMSNANIGFFKMDDQFTWPKDPKSFNLRGMTYSDIGLVNQELSDSTWGVLLRMVEESAYSPEAYRTLAQFLTEKGQPDWAADVELSRKLRERKDILTPWTGSWLWSWFLFIFSGYGQRPDFAFIWSFIVIAIGTIVFRKEDDMVILDDSEAKPPYSPILYSFALFLPYIDLGIASKWDPKPNRKFAGIYKHVHRLMGWVLMPIALLTFGGILG